MKKDQNIVSVIVPMVGRNSIEASKTALKKQTRHPDEIIIIRSMKSTFPSWLRPEDGRQLEFYLESRMPRSWTSTVPPELKSPRSADGQPLSAVPSQSSSRPLLQTSLRGCSF